MNAVGTEARALARVFALGLRVQGTTPGLRGKGNSRLLEVHP